MSYPLTYLDASAKYHSKARSKVLIYFDFNFTIYLNDHVHVKNEYSMIKCTVGWITKIMVFLFSLCLRILQIQWVTSFCHSKCFRQFPVAWLDLPSGSRFWAKKSNLSKKRKVEMWVAPNWESPEKDLGHFLNFLWCVVAPTFRGLRC